MTNEQVKAQWEASGQKARVQWFSNVNHHWMPRRLPLWDKSTTYRIHPDDVHMCETLRDVKEVDKTTGTKPPGKYDYARRMIDAIESGQIVQYRIDEEWIDDPLPDTAELNLLNDPSSARIKPKTVKRKLLVWFLKDGTYAITDPTKTTGHGMLIKEIEVEEEQ